MGDQIAMHNIAERLSLLDLHCQDGDINSKLLSVEWHWSAESYKLLLNCLIVIHTQLRET